MTPRLVLPTSTEERNKLPMCDGLLDYFPLALAEVAKVSEVGNKQHNPGQSMHWNREVSKDHANKIIKHLVDRGLFDVDGMRHSAKIAWRALALLQQELEDAGGNPGRGSVFASDMQSKSLAIAIDAEGGIGIIKRESNRRENYTLRVVVYNTNREFLENLQRDFGGSISRGHRPRSDKHATEYRLVWSHKQAAAIIERIFPFLVIKTAQASIARQFSNLVSCNQPGRKGTPESLLTHLRALKKEMNRLNSL